MGMSINYATVCVPTTRLGGVPRTTLEKMMGRSNAGRGKPFDCDKATRELEEIEQRVKDLEKKKVELDAEIAGLEAKVLLLKSDIKEKCGKVSV